MLEKHIAKNFPVVLLAAQLAGWTPNFLLALTVEGQDDERHAVRSTFGVAERYCRRGGDVRRAR